MISQNRKPISAASTGRHPPMLGTEDPEQVGSPSLLDELMTSDQVAAALLVRRSTVEDYARRGVIPSIKLGRHRRFIRADVTAAIERLRSGPRTHG
jgi:excisionase family DNA binding protein